MKRLSAHALSTALALSFVAGGVVFACSDATINEYCTGIPAHGCPGPYATNCSDPTCEALYTYDSSCVWTFQQKCPGYIPPPPDASADAAKDASSDAAPDAGSDALLHDADFTLPEGAAGGPGCGDLQLPDCPVALAAQCNDCCGCQDLWVCVEGGWNLWGQCSDAGSPVATPASR